MIQCKALTKSYNVDGEEVIILDGIDLEIKRGEFLVVMGESGCGKSTLLHCMSGMDAITSGEVWFESHRLDVTNEKKLRELRLHRFGFVFQDLNLIDILTLEENIAVPLFESKTYQKEKVVTAMKRFGIAHCAKKIPSKVSGGERQRAAIARALINAPDVLFVDEPTGSLDHENTVKIMSLFKQLNDNGQTIVMVTHDAYCAGFGSRAITLGNKTIIG